MCWEGRDWLGSEKLDLGSDADLTINALMHFPVRWKPRYLPLRLLGGVNDKVHVKY